MSHKIFKEYESIEEGLKELLYYTKRISGTQSGVSSALIIGLARLESTIELEVQKAKEKKC